MKSGPGEAQGLALGGAVLGDHGFGSGARLQWLEQRLAARGALGIDIVRAGEPRRTALGVGQVNEAGLRAEESGAAADIRIAHEHVGRHIGTGGAQFVGDDGADGRVGDAAADHAPGVDDIGGEGMLIDDVVIHGAHNGEALGQPRGQRQMLTKLDSRHGGVDRRVVGAGDFGIRLRVAASLGIEGIDLGHAAPEPDEDAMLGLALRHRDGRGIGEQRPGMGGGAGGEHAGAGEEGAAVHGWDERGDR
jgi:hypothetical protein